MKIHIKNKLTLVENSIHKNIVKASFNGFVKGPSSRRREFRVAEAYCMYVEATAN